MVVAVESTVDRPDIRGVEFGGKLPMELMIVSVSIDVVGPLGIVTIVSTVE
jgi:hypothetical protein